MRTTDQGVDWGAVWAGVLLAQGILVWLGAFCLAVGILALAPEAPRGAPLGTDAAAGVGIGITGVAFAVGGAMSARRAPQAPATHGLLAGSLGVLLSLVCGALGIGGIVGSLMGPLNLQVFAQRALQGLSGPAAVAAAATGLAGWFAIGASVAVACACLGARLYGRPAAMRGSAAGS